MKIILVGLGNNPRSNVIFHIKSAFGGNIDYTNTRHNVGMMFLNHVRGVLSSSPESSFSINGDLECYHMKLGAQQQISTDKLDIHQTSRLRNFFNHNARVERKDSIKLYLFNPQCYMNHSGVEFRRYLIRHEKELAGCHAIVCHDELDLPFGRFQTKLFGSANGHNGMKSVLSATGQDFPRIRIGIGRPETNVGSRTSAISQHVLGNFGENEILMLNQSIFPRIFNSLMASLPFQRSGN